MLLLLLLLIPLVQGWGKDGHYAVCKIAEEFLSEDALFAVNQLLPDSAQGDLAAVCSWPDEIRYNYHYRWSGALHYIDTPDFKCNYQYCRDCHDSYGHKDRCVTGAIHNYTMQLRLANADASSELKYNLTEALMFLSHFVGDVHQSSDWLEWLLLKAVKAISGGFPVLSVSATRGLHLPHSKPLHVGFTGDLGGNTITVRWYRRKTNLHHVWDNMIIESALKKFYDSDLSVMIQAIQRNISDIWLNDTSSWEHCAHNYTACPDRYASESISLACKFAYKNATPGSTLEDEYFLSRLPIVEKRLAQGGVRLAAILNRIFTAKTGIAQA
ncbi:nuclease S1 [Trifolium pratense]|uniref:Aspergillus nuclease S1 n=1 Tax=Trifolium pratense TaxID=57577 RepID=A0A2K3P1N4_TRIPR|nr:nuclease S1 [Trifolium pratense]